VSGELVVADVSELYINGIIGECHVTHLDIQDSGLPPPLLLAATVTGSIQARKYKDSSSPLNIWEI
jgi:hypothetical protein